MPWCLTSSPLESSPWAVPPAGQWQVHCPRLCLLLSKAPCSLLPPAGIRAQIGFNKVKLVRAGKGQEIWGDLDFTCFLPSPSCSPHAPVHNAKESCTSREVMDHGAKPFVGFNQALATHPVTPELRGEGQASSTPLWEDKEGLKSFHLLLAASQHCTMLCAGPPAHWPEA